MNDKEYSINEKPLNLLKKELDALYEKVSLDMFRDALKKKL